MAPPMQPMLVGEALPDLIPNLTPFQPLLAVEAVQTTVIGAETVALAVEMVVTLFSPRRPLRQPPRDKETLGVLKPAQLHKEQVKQAAAAAASLPLGKMGPKQELVMVGSVATFQVLLELTLETRVGSQVVAAEHSTETPSFLMAAQAETGGEEAAADSR